MHRAATCDVGNFGPTPPPRTEWRNLLVPDSGAVSDRWLVGEGDPGCEGWSVEYNVALAAGARLTATLVGFGRWQGSASPTIAANFSLDAHGRLWVPWARFTLAVTDVGAAGAGNDSTVSLFGARVPPGAHVSPCVYGFTAAATLAAAANSAVAVPAGATGYLIGLDAAATWAGPLKVEERVVGGGVTSVLGEGRYSQDAASAWVGRMGWRPTPPATGDLLVTNSDGGGVAVNFSVRWKYDLSRGR